MNTLEQLNNYSTTSITFTDNRPAGVVLSYPNARDIEVTLTGLTHVVQRRIDILEVIGGASADVTYEIDLDTVAGTVTWSTIPAGCTVVQIGNKFKITGITSKTIWDTVAAPTITLPSNFAGSFTYDATIRYYQGGTNPGYQTQTWEVGIFRPDAQLSSAATLTCSANRTRTTDAELESVCGFDIFFVKVMGVETTLTCSPTINADFGSATYSSSTTLSAKPRTNTYNDQTITIENTLPLGTFDFGDSFGLVRGQYIVIGYDNNASSLASVYSLGNGNKQFDIPIPTDGAQGDSFVFVSDNFVVIRNNNKWHLFKFNTSGDIYTHVESIDPPNDGTFDAVILDIHDDYMLAGLTTENSNDGEAYFYSLDGTTGFTLEATHTVTNVSHQERFGSKGAINDDYYVISSNAYTEPTATDRYKLRVYDTATNTLQRTITNSLEPQGFDWDGDDVIFIGEGNNGYITSIDVTSGTQNYSFSRSTGTFLGKTIRYLNSIYVAYLPTVSGQPGEAIEFVNVVNQDWDHRITKTTHTITQFFFEGQDKLILNLVDEDEIEIGIET